MVVEKDRPIVTASSWQADVLDRGALASISAYNPDLEAAPNGC